MQTNKESVLIENLRRLMAERDLSAQRLSYDARMPQSRISQILSGKSRNPTLDTLTRLSGALGVTIDGLTLVHESNDSQPTRN